ncbi:hypothetical protein J2769_000980 [Acinetobacter guillouiae]|nr:hypothetical protein [Acinetobacter guillouiae]BAP36442.1 hypothetical protein AS4_15020 [Acinetobacter guillouiae]
MKKIHFKLGILCLPLLMQGCATNDSNSPLVRFWNDGFIYTPKRGEANKKCSQESNEAQTIKNLNDDEQYIIYRNCMKKKGY